MEGSVACTIGSQQILQASHVLTLKSIAQADAAATAQLLPHTHRVCLAAGSRPELAVVHSQPPGNAVHLLMRGLSVGQLLPHICSQVRLRASSTLETAKVHYEPLAVLYKYLLVRGLGVGQLLPHILQVRLQRLDRRRPELRRRRGLRLQTRTGSSASCLGSCRRVRVATAAEPGMKLARFRSEWPNGLHAAAARSCRHVCLGGRLASAAKCRLPSAARVRAAASVAPRSAPTICARRACSAAFSLRGVHSKCGLHRGTEIRPLLIEPLHRQNFTGS